MRKINTNDARSTQPNEIIPQPHGGAMARNPPHKKTDQMVAKVMALRSLGNSYEAVAFACDFSPDTLVRHYKRELELAEIDANSKVGAAIYHSAVGERVTCSYCVDGTKDGKPCKTCMGTGEVWRREPNPTMAIWWSKNRMGWSDQQRVELVGDGGGPILTEQRSSADKIKARLEAIKARTDSTDKAA